MIIQQNIISDINIRNLSDLRKLKIIAEGSNLKLNKSQIARELKIDRRTCTKYLQGFEKSKTRQKRVNIDTHKKIINHLLLEQSEQVFFYRSVLYQYLIDNHDYKGSYSNFCKYLNLNNTWSNYFSKRKPTNVTPTIRFETDPGQQAQLDWKESIKFKLKSGEIININIFVLLLSYSRYRVYRLSLTKSQDVLLNFMDNAFETFGGVPNEILTDNMKTVMDVSRTRHSKGVINEKFQQFAKDYGFKVKPCIAGRPQTKAKVESPMRILDEIRAYNSKLDFNELNDFLVKLNDRENLKLHKTSGKLPIKHLQKEKDFLTPLPKEKIRKPYKIGNHIVKVNNLSMLNYNNSQYSVPIKYIQKELKIQKLDGYIYVYDNLKLVTIHKITNLKLNYHKNDYIDIIKLNKYHKEDDIEKIAKENIRKIGKYYK